MNAVQHHPITATPLAEPLPAGTKWVEVQTASHTIGFTLRRSRRKTIGLSITDTGLQVIAPVWTSQRQITQAINEKSGWILKKLQEQAIRQQAQAIAEQQWRHHGLITYLGVPIRLQLGQATASFQGNNHSPNPSDSLLLPLPASATGDAVRHEAHQWLQTRARDFLGQRLDHFLSVSGHSMSRWTLSSATTRWGSCTSGGAIRLNWRLIHHEQAIIDYVVAHEVAHLKHMNHSPTFWNEVARLLPSFKTARQALKSHSPATMPLAASHLLSL